MKIVNIVFILLFLVAAVLQLNDQDPFLWVVLYLSGVLVCGLALTGTDYRWLFQLLLIVYVAYAIYLFWSPEGVLSWYRDHEAENIAQSMKAEKPWIENTREFSGLLILSAAVVLNLVFRKK